MHDAASGNRPASHQVGQVARGCPVPLPPDQLVTSASFVLGSSASASGFLHRFFAHRRRSRYRSPSGSQDAHSQGSLRTAATLRASSAQIPIPLSSGERCMRRRVSRNECSKWRCVECCLIEGHASQEEVGYLLSIHYFGGEMQFSWK